MSIYSERIRELNAEVSRQRDLRDKAYGEVYRLSAQSREQAERIKALESRGEDAARNAREERTRANAAENDRDYWYDRTLAAEAELRELRSGRQTVAEEIARAIESDNTTAWNRLGPRSWAASVARRIGETTAATEDNSMICTGCANGNHDRCPELGFCCCQHREGRWVEGSEAE